MSVNILHHDDIALAQAFSRPTQGPTQDRFNSGDWTELKTGAPVLRDGTASFDCDVESVLDSGSHRIFIARVRDCMIGVQVGSLGYLDGRYVVPAIVESDVQRVGQQ